MSEQQPDHQAEARELADRVDAMLRRGSVEGARRAIAHAWRDAVPDLPLRFSVVLVNLNAKEIARHFTPDFFVALREGAAPPELELRGSGKNIKVAVKGARQRLGQLPREDAELLAQIGADAELYSPQLLEVNRDDEGVINSIAIELVRPETRICTSCGNKHDGPYPNCAACRAKRRQVGTEASEPSPVPFHEALDALNAELGDDQSQIDI